MKIKPLSEFICRVISMYIGKTLWNICPKMHNNPFKILSLNHISCYFLVYAFEYHHFYTPCYSIFWITSLILLSKYHTCLVNIILVTLLIFLLTLFSSLISSLKIISFLKSIEQKLFRLFLDLFELHKCSVPNYCNL